MHARPIRARLRRLALSTLAVAALVAPVSGAASAAAPAPTQRVVMPPSCSHTMFHFLPDANHTSYTYVNSGTIFTEPQGKFSYAGSLEQPKSFTLVSYPGPTPQPYGSYRGFISLRKNGELWHHRGLDGSTKRLSSSWGGITRIVGTDGGMIYGVTTAGALNAYYYDGLTIRSRGTIGTKGWTTLKSISGYGRADGKDSLVAVTAAGELVDYVVEPSGLIRASAPTQWRAGVSQVSVGACDDTPGRPLFVVIGSTMYAYYDRNALGTTATSLQDISSVGRIGGGWTGLLS